MSDSGPQPPRNANLLSAWFVELDEEKRNPLRSGRFRLLLLFGLLLLLLIALLLGSLFPENAPFGALQESAAWLLAAGILVLIALLWEVWRELLQPLLRLCDWADLMRGVNLEARVQLPADSEFNELARDINMLAHMIQNLSRDTEIQLQKHTDHITRESRSLAIQFDVAKSINELRDLNEVFDHSLQSLCNNLNASAGIIRQFHGKNNKEVAASFGNISRTFLASADRFLPIQDSFDDIPRNRIYSVERLDYETVFGSNSASESGLQLRVLSILLQHQDSVLGAIHLFFPEDTAPDLDDYGDLLLSIGQHLGSAVDKFRLLEKESEMLVMQERSRLSAELHDSLAQTIASLRIQIRVIDETFHSNDEKSIWHQMERIEYTIDQANNQLRELIAQFRVPINEQGLIPSIEDAIRATQEETGITIYFQNEWPEQEFSPDTELNLLRIVQECLANIRKHSQAEVVRVLLMYRDDCNIVIIEDDGIGFDESEIVSEGGRHLGLNILRDRAQQIGAEIDIESEPGDGTRINLQFRAQKPAEILKSTG